MKSLDFLMTGEETDVSSAEIQIPKALAAILFHFMENFSSELLGLADVARPNRFALMAGIAVFVVWRWGPHTLRGRSDKMAP